MCGINERFSLGAAWGIHCYRNLVEIKERAFSQTQIKMYIVIADSFWDESHKNMYKSYFTSKLKIQKLKLKDYQWINWLEIIS